MTILTNALSGCKTGSIQFSGGKKVKARGFIKARTDYGKSPERCGDLNHPLLDHQTMLLGGVPYHDVTAPVESLTSARGGAEVKAEVRHSDLTIHQDVEKSHACDNLPRCPGEFLNAFNNLQNSNALENVRT